MSIKIFHNPRCSKSRQTLQLLEEHGIQPEVTRYLENPPTGTELKQILTALNISARDLMRKKEAEYKENNLADSALSEDQLISAMVEHPRLIERPIVVNGDRVAIGRPPENVLTII